MHSSLHFKMYTECRIARVHVHISRSTFYFMHVHHTSDFAQYLRIVPLLTLQSFHPVFAWAYMTLLRVAVT